MTPVRTALLGFGMAGQVFHLPLMQAEPRIRVDAIVTASPDRGALARRAAPEAAIVASAEEVFARSDEFELVVVATPNQSHAPLARRAAEVGLNVVIDKPMAVTGAQARDVLAAATSSGTMLTVFQNRRWDGDFLTVRRSIDEGRLGDVHQFESAFEWFSAGVGDNWREQTTSRDGGGIAYDLASHLIDQAIRLFGPVRDLHAELDIRKPGGIADDDSFVALTHQSGVRSRLWMSTVAPSARARFRVVGSAAVLTVPRLDPQERQLIAGVRPGDTGFGAHEDGVGATLVSADGAETEVPLLPGRYVDFYRGVADAILDGSPAPVDPGDSIAVLELIERAVRGAHS